MRPVALVSLIVCLGLFGCTGEEERSAVALEREMHRVSEGRQFWPGYDPLAVPLAIFDGTTIACIGPVTAQTARELGLEPDLVAEEHTIEGLVQAILERY